MFSLSPVHHLIQVRPLILGAFCADILLRIVATAGYRVLGRWADALDVGAALPGLALLLGGLWRWEARFVAVLLVFCAVDAGMCLADEWLAHGTGDPLDSVSAAAQDVLTGDGAFLVLALGCLAWRRVALRRARRLLAGDQLRYGAAWAAVADADAPALADLRAAVASVACGCGGRRLQQLSPPQSGAIVPPLAWRLLAGTDAALGCLLWSGCSGGIATEKPVNSLDQLFTQAIPRPLSYEHQYQNHHNHHHHQQQQQQQQLSNQPNFRKRWIISLGTMRMTNHSVRALISDHEKQSFDWDQIALAKDQWYRVSHGRRPDIRIRRPGTPTKSPYRGIFLSQPEGRT